MKPVRRARFAQGDKKVKQMGVTDHGKHESPYKLVSWLKMFHKDNQAKALQQNLPFIGQIKHLQARERLDQCSDSVV